MNFKKPFLMATILLFTFVFSISAQDDNVGDIGNFNIDLVNEDVAAAEEEERAAFWSADANTPVREPENYAIVLLRVMGYLVIVTVVIFAVAWAVRKFGVAGLPKSGGGNNMDIIETLYVGQGRAVTLTRVGDAVYLIGHTQENIVMLEKIEGEKAIELIASSKSGSTIVSFKDAFNNFMGKMKKS